MKSNSKNILTKNKENSNKNISSNSLLKNKSSQIIDKEKIKKNIDNHSLKGINKKIMLSNKDSLKDTVSVKSKTDIVNLNKEITRLNTENQKLKKELEKEKEKNNKFKSFVEEIIKFYE